MKPSDEFHQELRQRILSLPGVIEWEDAGIQEDVFFVGSKMFMHIHGRGHCDSRLFQSNQKQVLAAGKARPHRQAPQAGYVTFIVDDEEDLWPAMDLILMSHHHLRQTECSANRTPIMSGRPSFLSFGTRRYRIFLFTMAKCAVQVTPFSP